MVFLWYEYHKTNNTAIFNLENKSKITLHLQPPKFLSQNISFYQEVLFPESS